MSGKVVAYAALMCILCGGLFAAAEPAFVPGNTRSLKGGAGRSHGPAIQSAARQKPSWPPQRPIRQRPAARTHDLCHRGGRFGDAFMVDTGIVYVPSSSSQYSCGAASNGDGWRVMWWDENYYAAYTSGVGPDGSVLDGAGKVVEGQGGYGPFGTRSIVGTGSGFIAVWTQDYYGIWASRLDSTGGLIDSFLVYENGNEQEEPAIAFDGDSTCLVVWTEYIGNGDIYAIRVTTGGRVLDQQPIPVANQSAQDEMTPVVAFGQGVYLVAWTSASQGWFTWATAKAVRVAEDGAVIDTAVFLRHDATSMQAYPAVAFGDSCFLVSWSEGIEQPDVYAQRLSASGARVDTTAVQLSSGPDYDLMSSIGFGGTRYLVMWEEDDPAGDNSSLRGRRMTSDGVLLDSGLIRWGLDGYDCQSPSVSADQANFLVALTTYDTMHYREAVCCVRIDPDGAVLDTGIFFGLTADAQYYPSGASDGNQFLASWLESRGTGSVVSAARISADGRMVDPVGFTVCSAAGYKSYLSTAYGDSIYLMAWQDQSGSGSIYCARVTSDGRSLDPDGIVVSNTGSYAYSVDVASDGRNFLVVWEDYRSGVNNIYAARISPTGVVLDPDGFAVAAADTFYDEAPVVCFPGPNYLVVWGGNNINNWETNIYGALVNPAGQVVKQRFAVCDQMGDQYTPSVASGPTNSLVVWQDESTYPTTICAARVRSDGVVLDPGGVSVDSSLDSDVSALVNASETGFNVLCRCYDYNWDTTHFSMAQIDTAGHVSQRGEWFALPGSDDGFDAVSCGGAQLLLFSFLADDAQGRYHAVDRLWGRLGDFSGIEQAVGRQPSRVPGGATIVHGVLFVPRSLDPSLARPLLDVSGRKVLDLKPGANDVSRLAPGVYFVGLASNGKPAAKVVLTR
jgi:hypothetical protein